MNIKYFDCSVVGCFVILAIFTCLSLVSRFERDLYYLGIGIVSSIILFILAARLDKKSTDRMLIILDDDMRNILRLLERGKTFSQLDKEYKGTSSLMDDLKILKKMKLVKETEEIEGEVLKKRYSRNL